MIGKAPNQILNSPFVLSWSKDSDELFNDSFA